MDVAFSCSNDDHYSIFVFLKLITPITVRCYKGREKRGQGVLPPRQHSHVIHINMSTYCKRDTVVCLFLTDLHHHFFFEESKGWKFDFLGIGACKSKRFCSVIRRQSDACRCAFRLFGSVLHTSIVGVVYFRR